MTIYNLYRRHKGLLILCIHIIIKQESYYRQKYTFLVSDIILSWNLCNTRWSWMDEIITSVLTLIYLDFFNHVIISSVCSTFVLCCHNKNVQLGSDKDALLNFNVLVEEQWRYFLYYLSAVLQCDLL